MIFFFAKISIFCKSIASPFPSVVQAYTQPYSFGGRIKLLICPIRHELSVTIHEISTIWKESVRRWTLYDITRCWRPRTQSCSLNLPFLCNWKQNRIISVLVSINDISEKNKKSMLVCVNWKFLKNKKKIYRKMYSIQWKN